MKQRTSGTWISTKYQANPDLNALKHVPIILYKDMSLDMRQTSFTGAKWINVDIILIVLNWYECEQILVR